MFNMEGEAARLESRAEAAKDGALKDGCQMCEFVVQYIKVARGVGWVGWGWGGEWGGED
jgi:hypothetical protein